MTLKLNRKRSVVMALVAALAISVAAVAYWTTTGSGSGTGTAGTDADNLVITGTVGGLLTPNGDGQTVSFVVDNPSEFNQSVSKITLDSVSAKTAAGEDIALADCGGPNGSGEDFRMADVIVDPTTDGDIVRETTDQALTATGTLYMNNLDVNQDACKNALLTLHLSSE